MGAATMAAMPTNPARGLLAALGRSPQAVAVASAAVDALLIVGKLTMGILTGSLGLLSEAAHSTFDLVASLFAVFAVRASSKPADQGHPYGHGRAENLAAYTEGVLLALVAIGIAFEAVRRIVTGGGAVDVRPAAIGLLVLTIGIEVIRATVLASVARANRSEALRAASVNRLADIVSSSGVLIGLLGVRAGWAWADAAAALLVAGLVGRGGALLLRRSGDILIDAAPTGLEQQVSATIAEVSGVRSVSGVRVRRSGSRILGEATVSTRGTLSVAGANDLAHDVRTAVNTEHPDLDLTLVVEPATRAATLVERVHAAAARQRDVRDLHNVLVEREEDGSLHVSMHAKLPGTMTLEQATAASAELESVMRTELPGVVRVDVHLEPLEADWVSGENVTGRMPDLTARVRSAVERHPGVVGCRDVELSAREGRVYAHVVAEMPGEATLDRAHAVETELEDALKADFTELADVVARATA